MKMVLKFKDGAERTREFPGGITAEGSENLFNTLKDVAIHNGDLTFYKTDSDEKEVRKFNDLHSIEIIL